MREKTPPPPKNILAQLCIICLGNKKLPVFKEKFDVMVR